MSRNSGGCHYGRKDVSESASAANTSITAAATSAEHGAALTRGAIPGDKSRRHILSALAHPNRRHRHKHRHRYWSRSNKSLHGAQALARQGEGDSTVMWRKRLSFGTSLQKSLGASQTLLSWGLTRYFAHTVPGNCTVFPLPPPNEMEFSRKHKHCGFGNANLRHAEELCSVKNGAS